MNTTIWKYRLSFHDTQSVKMPESAEILSAQMQGESFYLWALVDPRAPVQSRKIEMVGTGNPMPEGERRYISTVQEPKYSNVWHIFEAK